MFRLIRSSLVLHLLLLVSSAVSAATITWTFSGTVLTGYGIDRTSPSPKYTGRFVSGSFTFDPTLSTLPCDGMTDGATWQFGCSAPLAGAAGLGGFATDGFNVLAVGTGGVPTKSKIGLYRDFPQSNGGYNAYYLAVSDASTSIDMYVNDFLGNNTQIFTDPEAGFNWSQPINWFPSGTESLVRIGNADLFEQVRLDSITVTTDGTSVTQFRINAVQSVPEPGTSWVFGIGLATIVAARRYLRRA